MPEHIIAMILTGIVGLCVYRLVEIIRESEAEADARVHRNVREMRQRLEEDQRRVIEQFNLTQLEARLDELRQKRDQIILDALSKAEKEKRKKDDELTEIAQKCKPALRFDDPIYAAGQLTEQQRQMFYDGLAQELGTYGLTQDEDEGGHGQMTFREIGAAIRRARESMDPKMTQKQLAAKIGKTESSIAKYEQGLVEIPLSVVVEIAEALGKEPVDLLGSICDPREYGDDSAQHDPVNHPAHYTAGGIECIDAIAAALTCQTDPMDAWLTGQVLKYLWRWPLKNGKEDLEKARWYLDRLIRRSEAGK